MTALRSLNIVADIRTALKDREYKLIDSDEQIFAPLTDIQSLLATNYIITPIEYEVDLFNGQDEYVIDKFIQKITDIRRKYSTDPKMKIEIGGYTGDNDRILYVSNPMDIIDGQVLILNCFMRVAISSGDIINEDTDPILDEQYDKFLTEMFLADYKSEKNNFRKRDEVLKELYDYVSEQISISFGLLSNKRSVKLVYEIR
ncbi:MAG: hypothetical protein WC358_07030, partial [Ignavibacteria bacterium]